MHKNDSAEIRRFIYNESCRLEQLSKNKWHHVLYTGRFDTLDLLDLIELAVQVDYLNYLEKRVYTLLDLLTDSY